MQNEGIEYFCSDEENLFNSIKRDPAYKDKHVDHIELFQGWRVEHDGSAVNAVFRERPLSDFIGFTAAKNVPQEAADHMLHHLTHIASRKMIGAGELPNTRGYLAGWILNASALKPGVHMPPTQLSSDDLNALLDYLESLK